MKIVDITFTLRKTSLTYSNVLLVVKKLDVEDAKMSCHSLKSNQYYHDTSFMCMNLIT